MRAKTVNEAISFQRHRDPKEALGLDPFEYDIEWKGDITDENSDEIQKAKEWRFNGVGVLKISGVIDDDEYYFDIDLSDGDYIRFDSHFETGPVTPRPGQEYAQITIHSEDIFQKDVLEKFMEYFSDGYIILAVLKCYEDEKRELKESGFRKHRDPKEALMGGKKALVYEIIKETEKSEDIDWDFLNYNEETAELAIRYFWQEYPEELSKDFSWKLAEVREAFGLEYQAIINLKLLTIKSVLSAYNSDIYEYKFKQEIEDKIIEITAEDIVKQIESIYTNLWEEEKYNIAYEAYEEAIAIKYKDDKNLRDDYYEG